MSKKSSNLGGVRELSYDSRYAKPYGQTAEQIAVEAAVERYGWCLKHQPKPNRFFLLRFLGLDAARFVKANIGQQA